jgi:hypothetical protein
MLKLNASYSKKVPAELEYSSKSFMACIEVELPTGATAKELQAKIHDTFALVKQSVEDEIQETAGGPAEQHQPVPHKTAGTEGKASNKQISYLLDLSKARDIPLIVLNADVQKRFGVISVYELSRKDCSRMIDEFQQAA